MLSLSNLPVAGVDGTYLLVANDGSDAINGTFASIIGLPGGFSATVDYAFNGTDSLGRTGNGNDLAVHVVPEPQSLRFARARNLAPALPAPETVLTSDSRPDSVAADVLIGRQASITHV